MNIIAELLSSIRCHITESFVMEILACPFAQKKFTKSLIERALGQPISEDAYIHLDDGTAIKMKHVFDYPYFKRAITKVTLSPPYKANLFSPLPTFDWPTVGVDLFIPFTAYSQAFVF